MAHALKRLKTTEVSSQKLATVPTSFAAALEERKIFATPDAQKILLDLDKKTDQRRPLPANDDVYQYVLLSVERPRDNAYIARFAHRLLRLGWKLFFDREALLYFACEEFQFVLTSTCESVSLPLLMDGKLMPLILSREGSGALVVDVHPADYAFSQLVWAVERGENLLICRR